MELWREAFDKNTNRVYYYNTKTREASWQLPGGHFDKKRGDTSSGISINDDQSEIKENCVENKFTSKGCEQSTRKVYEYDSSDNTKNNAKMEIREARDFSTGRIYYYDRVTRRTFWNDPRTINHLNEKFRNHPSKSPADEDETACNSSHNQFLTKSNQLSSAVRLQNTQLRDAQTEEVPDLGEAEHEDISPSIDEVRASLKLLKQKMKNRTIRSNFQRSKKIREPDTSGRNPAKNGKDMWTGYSEHPNEICGGSGMVVAGQPNLSAANLLLESTKEITPKSTITFKVSLEPETPKSMAQNPLEKKSSNWRQQSAKLRNVIRSVKGNVNHKLQNEALVGCPHCERTFEPSAAERHIPICSRVKARPKRLKRRTGHGAFLNAKAYPRHETFEQKLETPNSQQKSRNARRRLSVSVNGIKRIPCPYCEREFDVKAFERHEKFCKSLDEDQRPRTATKRGFCSATKARSYPCPV